MTILVVQNTAGTTALNGTAPNPTNVPGNNWVADAQSSRLAGGGVGIPSAAFWLNNAAYNLGTARQKISASNIVVPDSGNYVRACINKDAGGSNPYSSGTGYALVIQGGSLLAINSWSGSSTNTTLAYSASSIPVSSPYTITSLVFEHLTNGTLNASVVIGGTTYSATATVGAPLSGQWLGFFNTSGAGGGISFASIQFEDEVSATYTYARPTSDITTQWSTSTGTDHFALIDETTANDSDYIYATAAGQTDEVRLASMSAPQAGTDLLINYKVAGIVGSASVTMSLRQGSGGTLIATDTAKTIDNTYQLVVPAATWASVTDWTDLRLRFVSA
jgi:hypothetical protein